MKVKDKTREQLTEELEELRRQVTELEALEARYMAQEMTLNQANEEKESILDSLVEHVVYHDLEMKVLWANRAACDSIGMTREELLGRHCYEVWAKRSDPCEDCPVKWARETGQLHTLEKTTPDGRYWYIQASGVRDGKGDIVGMVELTLEITERKRAEEELRDAHLRAYEETRRLVEERTAELMTANKQLKEQIEQRKHAEEALTISEEKYRLLVQSADEAIVVSQDRMLKFVNPKAVEISGYSEEELISQSFIEFVHPDDREKVVDQHVRRLSGEEEPEQYDFRIVDKAGNTKWVRNNGVIIDWQGKPATLNLLSDITQNKLSEDQLKRTERLLFNTFDALQDLLVVIDKDFRVVMSNWKDHDYILEEKREDHPHCYTCFMHRDSPCEPCPAKETFASGRVQEFEKANPIDGETREIRVLPIFDESGDVAMVVEHLRNVTAQKQTLKTLKESEEFNASLLRNSPNPIQVINPDTSIRYVNPAFEKLTGFSSSNLVGTKPPYPWWPEKTVEEVAERFQKAIHEGVYRVEQLFRKESGEQFWAEITGVPVTINGELNYYLSNWVDISKRKMADAALRKSEATVRALLNAPNELVMLLDRKGFFIEVNQATARRFNMSVDEIIGLTPNDLLEPEVAERRKGAVVKVIETAKPFQFEDEGLGSWWDTIVYPVLDSEGNVARIAVVARDITERKQTEEQVRRLSQEVIKAQEVERQRLAADLHDRLAQDLASVKVGLDTLYGGHQDNPHERRQKVSELSRLLERTLMAVRDKSYDLHPPSLKEFGLAHTVQQNCEEFASKNSLKVDFFSVGMDDLELDFDTEIAFYRLVQEGLTNIRKHADASQVIVRLSASFSHIMLHIEDNGKGFEVKNRLAAALNERRMGIWSMEQRVAFLNGKMKIESDPMHGTKILIKVPHLDEANG